MKDVIINLPRINHGETHLSLSHGKDSKTVMDLIKNWHSENPNTIIYSHIVESIATNIREHPFAHTSAQYPGAVF